MLKVLKTSFRGNPSVGLYLYATDTYCLAGPEVPEEEYKAISETLGVPVHRQTIAGTGLLGVFLAGTSAMLLIPAIASARERKNLEKAGIPYAVIETDFTALGNNMLCSDRGCLVSEEYPAEDRKAIEAALGIKTKQARLADLNIIGSCAVVTSTGCLCHRDAASFELDLLHATFNVPITQGTVNLGNPYIKAGLVANAHGLVVGDLSGGPEIVNAEEALRG